MNGRDPASLIFLSPGVTSVLDTPAGTLPTSAAFPNEVGGSGNGGQQGSMYALLDGVPNMDFCHLLMAPFPNQDARHAFRAVTNNYSVQYGFSPSAIINIETDYGTNSIHGGVFEFIRNGALNASNWFSGAVDNLKQNQFGGYIGAPIIKDKLFIFANYQGTRKSLASSTETSYTPTAAMLNISDAHGFWKEIGSLAVAERVQRSNRRNPDNVIVVCPRQRREEDTKSCADYGVRRNLVRSSQVRLEVSIAGVTKVELSPLSPGKISPAGALG